VLPRAASWARTSPAVILSRDVVAEIWVTKIAGLTMTDVEKIVDAALSDVFDVCHS
jgi:hypothetical protein